VVKGVYIKLLCTGLPGHPRASDFHSRGNLPWGLLEGVFSGSVASVTESVGRIFHRAPERRHPGFHRLGEERDSHGEIFPDENKSPYVLTQGKIGIKRSFPVNDQIQAAVTVSAEEASVEFSGKERASCLLTSTVSIGHLQVPGGGDPRPGVERVFQ
jgi:hypothetical protein